LLEQGGEVGDHGKLFGVVVHANHVDPAQESPRVVHQARRRLHLGGAVPLPAQPLQVRGNLLDVGREGKREGAMRREKQAQKTKRF
jgi:hypothetical protein